ncbi:hypothetical protein ATI61_102166 [Archangium gephyra]|uniref:Uncharacterized protein n=1 Tax=Archangium gephyra TaxID=48 RepID=A0AAC8TGD5_9BACT|nr:hypothetical protein [Archangium gephyra]AKJ05097.1 Hypothetical protein AA314_06723 [Archangium gephyra]REG35798.1 hypothetical protein ATI61_102166 [Archangium gephyra]
MRIRAHIAGHLIATLLVVLWVAQPLIAIAHAREHVHRYCPTHRAFEESSASKGSALSAQLRDAKAFEKVPPTSPGGTLKHESCAFVSVSTRDEVTSPEVQPVIQACLEVSRPATAPPRPQSSLSILDTAPKGSPPARV